MNNIKVRKENIIYALHYKGQLMGTFKWSNYGPDYLQGWRPPKKVYFTIGTANNGATHLPNEILDDIELVEYQEVRVIKKYSKLEREKNFLVNKIKKTKLNLEYQRKAYQDEYKFVAEKEAELKKLENKLSKL